MAATQMSIFDEEYYMMCEEGEEGQESQQDEGFFALHDTLGFQADTQQDTQTEEAVEHVEVKEAEEEEEIEQKQEPSTQEALFDADHEEALKATILKIAFEAPGSVVTAPNEPKWVDKSIKDEKGNGRNAITSHYRFLTSTAYQQRASMLFQHNHDDIMNYYAYLESGNNDDDMTWTNKANLNMIIKVIDSDHQIMYNQGNGGWMNSIISARDTCYIRTRFKYHDFVYNHIKYDVAGSLHYSADRDHPFYYPDQEKCVRVNMKYRGFILIKNKELKQTQLVYVAYFDIKGNIPQFLTENGIKNIATNYVKAFNESWLDKIANLKERRKVKQKQQMKWWLTEVLCLPQYVDVFLENGFEDLSYLKDTGLSEEDLIDIGIHLKGHRMKLLSEIQKL